MALSKRLWAVLLAAVLVAGLLVGFGGGDEAVAKEPRATIGKIMVPAAAFIPTSDNWDYDSVGWSLGMVSGSGGFTAPLSFPVPVVNIRRITFFAYDATWSDEVCVNLHRSSPAAGTAVPAGGRCTRNRTALPQKVGIPDLSPRRVNTAVHGSYLFLSMEGKPPSGSFFWGVEVLYSH